MGRLVYEDGNSVDLDLWEKGACPSGWRVPPGRRNTTSPCVAVVCRATCCRRGTPVMHTVWRGLLRAVLNAIPRGDGAVRLFDGVRLLAGCPDFTSSSAPAPLSRTLRELTRSVARKDNDHE